MSLRELYLLETLARAERARHRRSRAPGDEGPRRPLARGSALLAGRALVTLGLRLLAYGGERTSVLLTPSALPTGQHQN